MKIGVIDYDLYKKPQVKRLNADAMKVCNYYQEKGCEVAILSPADNIFHWDKIIFFVEKIYPNLKEQGAFQQHPNIDFAGTAYSNGYYIPFNNEEINYSKIQTNFYNNILKYYYKTKVLTLDTIKQIKGNYTRIYPTERNINLDSIMTGEKYYLMDNYIYNYNNWQDTVKYLSIFNRNFFFLFPQLIESENDLQKFTQLTSYQLANTRGLIRISNLDEYKSFINNNCEILKQNNAKLFYDFAFDKNNIYSEKFYKQMFCNSFSLLELLLSKGIKAHFTFVPYSNYIFTQELLHVFSTWINTYFDMYSFNEYVYRLRKRLILHKQFTYLIAHNPELQPLVNKLYKKEE